MKLKQTLLAAACGWALTAPVFAGGEGWIQDFAKAREQASKEGKDLLMDFTGSDWCGWCIKLNDEVFSKEAFKADAPKHFVLVELDYPRDKSKLTEDIQKQNAELQKQFSIQGYPTILLADAQGRPYAQTGYQDGGPDEYITHLAELRSVRQKRDEAWKAAESAQGVEKAKLLARGLTAMPEDLASAHYMSTIEEIKKLDPKDETGVVGRMEIKGKMKNLQTSVAGKAQGGEKDAANKEIDQFISTNKLEGESKQRALMLKLMLMRPPADNAAAAALMADVVAVDANTEPGKQAAAIRERIEKMSQAAKEPGANTVK